MVKFGILSDTHISEDEDPIKVNKLLDRLKKVFHDVDEIIHAGDVCVDFFLNELNMLKPTKCVSGNMDKIINLKKFLTFNISQYKIGVIHELPNDLEKFTRENGLHILIFGHTHQPLIKGTLYNVLILNPGSPSKPKAPPKIIGFKEPIARKTVLTLDINEKNEMITTYIINL
ncbi:MAG: YfcE family phosphodiesterase [Promethearchaeota archaeon]